MESRTHACACSLVKSQLACLASLAQVASFDHLQLFQLVPCALHYISTRLVFKHVFLCFIDLFAFIYLFQWSLILWHYKAAQAHFRIFLFPDLGSAMSARSNQAFKNGRCCCLLLSLLLLLLLFWGRSWSGAGDHHVAQAGLKLTILSQSPTIWDDRSVSP